MNANTGKKILDGLQARTFASARHIAKKHLNPPAALRLKLCLACLLYGTSFVVAALLFSRVQATLELPRIEITNMHSTTMLVWLKDCAMHMTTTDGSSVTLSETTMYQDGRPMLHTEFNETLGVLSVTCSGPASLSGETVTVVVEVGRDTNFERLEVIFEPDDGKSLFRANFSDLSDASLGLASDFSASGQAGILQIYGGVYESFSIQLDSGLVFLYEVDFQNANFVFGGEVDVYLWQDTYHRGMHVNLQTGDGQNASAGLCLSDWTAQPALQASNMDAYDYTFTLGPSTDPRIVNITRGSALSRLYLAHGVWRSQRHCANTFDSVVKLRTHLDKGFDPWADVAEERAEMMHLFLMGPSLGSEIQSMTAEGFWIFSVFGDALMWFPVGLWNIFTMGIFSPRTKRGVFLVKDSLCLSNHDRLTVGAPNCRPKNSTEVLLHHQVLERCTLAWRNSLPDGLNLSNSRNGRIYYVEHKFDRGKNLFPAIADQSVDIMSPSTSAFVKEVHGPEELRGLWGMLFVVVMIILALTGGILACVLVITLYKMQKRRYLKCRTSPHASLGSELKCLYRLEDKCNLLLTLARCLILRSPSGKAKITVQNVFMICVGHFIVMQLLVTPTLLIAILNGNNMAELRAICNFNEWLTGGCLNIRHRALSTTMLLASIIMNAIFFLNTQLEYLTRHGLDLAEETGDCPRFYRVAMKFRASKVYSAFLTLCFMVSLFFFCAYFILVIIFILLGTLLKPERLAPVLLAVVGAVIVAQQVTQKFEEFVEQAKVMAAEWLAKNVNTALDSAKDFLGDVGSQVGNKMEGLAGSALDSLESVPFAKEALTRVGVNADSFKADLIMNKVQQATEMAIDSTADQIGKIAADPGAAGTLMNIRSTQDAMNSAQKLLDQVADNLPGRVSDEAETMLHSGTAAGALGTLGGSAVSAAVAAASTSAVAKDALGKLDETRLRSLMEQTSSQAGVDPSAIMQMLQASGQAGIDPSSIMQVVSGSADRGGSLAAARSLMEQASGQAGVDPSAIMKMLQASGQAGIDPSSIMQAVSGSADQGGSLAAARSLMEQASGQAGVDPSAIMKMLQASGQAGIDPASTMQAVSGSADQAGSLAAARSLMEQASGQAGVDPSAIMKMLQASGQAGIDPSSIMQAFSGSADQGSSLAAARSLMEQASGQAGVDPSAMMQMLQASGQAGIDPSSIMQAVSGAADQGGSLVVGVRSLMEQASNEADGEPSGRSAFAVANSVLKRAVTGVVETLDLEAPDLDEIGQDESLDLENVLVMLGLSKGQLLLININAILVFLSVVGFTLIGSSIFLGGGIDALIPQLTSTAGTLASTVAVIRSKKQELKNADLSAMSGALKDAAGELQNPGQNPAHNAETKKEQ